MGADELVTLLLRLVQHPEDSEARGKVADVLDKRGQHADALGVLGPFINFTGHEEPSPLPCLCKACFAKAPPTAETGGITFTRTFVTHDRRVLHFWLADELARERIEVRRAVGDALKSRLKRKKKRKA